MNERTLLILGVFAVGGFILYSHGKDTGSGGAAAAPAPVNTPAAVQTVAGGANNLSGILAAGTAGAAAVAGVLSNFDFSSF